MSENYQAQHDAYVSDPDFNCLAAMAAARGMRKADPQEVCASARSEWWAPDVYCWRGGLWVREN